MDFNGMLKIWNVHRDSFDAQDANNLLMRIIKEATLDIMKQAKNLTIALYDIRELDDELIRLNYVYPEVDRWMLRRFLLTTSNELYRRVWVDGKFPPGYNSDGIEEKEPELKLSGMDEALMRIATDNEGKEDAE